MHPDFQGRGLATEAAAAVLAAAAAGGVGHVIALTDPDNVASQAVAIRLGMRDDGITARWYGLTSLQFHKTLSGCHLSRRTSDAGDPRL